MRLCVSFFSSERRKDVSHYIREESRSSCFEFLESEPIIQPFLEIKQCDRLNK